MRTTVSKLVRQTIYAVVYGATGVGKTLLPMSLADAAGRGVSFVTADQSGLTSVLTQGYPGDIPVEILPAAGEDPFPMAVAAIESFTRDSTIKVICVDGATTICMRAVDFHSGGEGEKALGYDGWGMIFNGFRLIEAACDKATRANKSVVITALETPPEYEDIKTLAGRVKTLTKEGTLFVQGKGRVWVPSQADIFGRMTGKFVSKNVNGKVERKYKAELWVNREGALVDWDVRSRWKLPSPCPADLRWILDHVKTQGGSTLRVGKEAVR